MSIRPDNVDVDRFRHLVTRRLGLALDDAKLGFLGEVLGRRLAACGGTLDGYLATLASPSAEAEIGALAQELTVPETYFFRNIDQFHVLRECALPDRLAARSSQGPVRILSAGCASGEEALSIAMVAEDVAGLGGKVAITAVDLNPAILRKAAAGRFSNWAFRETPPDVQRRWFRKEVGEFVVADALLRSVRFEVRNLVDDDAELWRPQSQDIVFCRNVLMYFPADAARAVVARLAEALAAGGYLFLGHAETLRGLSQDFHLRHSHGTFYYQRRGAAGQAQADPAPAARPTVRTEAGELEDQDWVAAIDRSAGRIQRLADRAPRAAATAAAQERSEFGQAFDLLSRERYSEAIALLDTRPAAVLDDPDAMLLRAALLAHSGRLALAEAACRRLLKVDEMSAGAHHVLALCREGSGDTAGAAEQDRMAAHLDPAFAMPRLRLGQRARRRGDLETARRELSQALVLLRGEDPARLLLFGGGFRREALLSLCQAELQACEVAA